LFQRSSTIVGKLSMKIPRVPAAILPGVSDGRRIEDRHAWTVWRH
jgi:hypothetical protein